MEQKRFWELLAKMNAGEASPEEQLELNQYLSHSKEDQDLAVQVNQVWKAPIPPNQEVTKEETDRQWDSLRRQIRESGKEEAVPLYQALETRYHRLRFYKLSAAAVLLISLTSIAWWWSGHNFPGPSKKNIISTRNGSKTKVELPDGTQVWLNAGSRIVYDEAFATANREIQLEGEAYFDVTHNAENPFIIHTREMDVKVLGTVFNVRAYPNDKTTEASLIKGSIEISFPGSPTEKLILRPNEKISIANSVISLTPAEVAEARAPKEKKATPFMSVSGLTYQPADSMIVETAWVKNKLIFRSKTFGELSADMERRYNVTIRFADSAIREKIFTGTFDNESVTEALEALRLSYAFRYKFDKTENTITLYKN